MTTKEIIMKNNTNSAEIQDDTPQEQADMNEKSAPTIGSWFDTIDDDSVKEYITKKNFPNVTELARSYQNIEKTYGGKTISAPDYDNESLPEFFKKNADVFKVPSRADDYVLQEFKLPEGMEVDNDLMNAVKQAAVENSIPPDFVQVIADVYAQYVAQNYETNQQTVEAEKSKAIAALQKEWGKNYETNSHIAKLAIANMQLAPEEEEALQRSIESPVLLKLFHKLGQNLSEDTIRQAMTPQKQDQERLQEIANDPALVKKYAKGDPAIINEIARINERLANNA